MKCYPPITKKEFRELCELSSGPVEVGSAVVARAEAELFRSMRKRDYRRSGAAGDKTLLLRDAGGVISEARKTSTVGPVKKNFGKRLTTKKIAAVKSGQVSHQKARGVREIGAKKSTLV